MKLAQPLDSIYILPLLYLFPNLEEWHQPLSGEDYQLKIEQNGKIDFQSLLSFKRLMVLAEPGYGKTELLEQIEKAYPPAACKKISCKELKGRSVTPYLGDNEQLTTLQYVLFDALDEVDAQAVAETIRQIQEYADGNPDVVIMISCRIHYMVRFFQLFHKLEEFKFLKINAFFDSDIRRYLEHYLQEEEAIGHLIDKTKVNGNRSVLSTPRYLRALVVALSNDSLQLSDLPDLKITDLFDKLIYHKLEEDAKKDPKKFSKNEIELTRRVLEKISLIMEIYQTNTITREDLITILDETVSNVNLIFLNYSSIDTFIDRILKQTGDNLEFEHTEFQEYLAARQLIRMANKEQALYDLILDPDLQHIYPAWYDVLKFSVELSPEIILNLTRYLGYKQNFQVDEKLIDIILSIEPRKLSETDQAFLFTTLANYYEKSGQYIGHRYHQIAQFYSPVLNVNYTAIQPDESPVKRAFANRIDIIRGIVVTGKLRSPQVQEWTDFLIGRLADTESDDIAETISFVLEVFPAFGALKALWPQITHRIDKVVQNYMITLFRMRPEDPFCFEVLKYVIECRQKIEVSDIINLLAGPENLNGFFDFLLAKQDNLGKTFRGDSSYRAYHELFNHIEAQNEAQLNLKVGHVFSGLLNSRDHYHLYGNKRQFVDHALKYFWHREPGFLEQLFKLPKAGYFLREYGSTIVELMDFAEFGKIEAFLLADGSDWELRTMIAKLNILGDQERRKLRAEIKAACPQYFEVRNPQPQEPEIDTSRDDLVYTEYSGYLHLHRTDNLVYEDLFPFVFQNWEVLAGRSTSEETEQVRQLLARTLDRLNPEEFILEIEREGNRSSYAHNSPNWFRFDLLINLALLLKLPDVVAKQRLKIIYYLPLIDNYVSNAARLGDLLARIMPVTEAEINTLLDFCIQRTDDYLYSSTLTFIDLIRDQKLTAFTPILVLYIEDKPGKTDLGEKSKALDVYAALTRGTNEGKKFLQKLFRDQSGSTGGEILLRQRANAHLVTYHEDDEAIAWRFGQLKADIKRVDDNAVTLSRSVSYTAAMNEMEQPTYGNCFRDNPAKKLAEPMFDLLGFSFELRKQSDALRYSNYLQRIIFDYFNQVKSIPLINRLRTFVNEAQFESRGSSCKHLLKQMEMDFIAENKHYSNIAEAVQSFNELNAKRYVRIRDEADLTQLLNQVIAEDIRNVIENEGFYSIAQRLTGTIAFKQSGHVDEDMIQRTLKIIFENALLKRGLRSVDIYREPELLDSKRYDYLIKYGFIGPVVVELKRLDNDEIINPAKRTAYKTKLQQYLNGVNSSHGFYLIFQVLEDKDHKAKAQFELMFKEYNDIKGLHIAFLDCWGPVKDLLPEIAKKKAAAAKKAADKKAGNQAAPKAQTARKRGPGKRTAKATDTNKSTPSTNDQ